MNNKIQSLSVVTVCYNAEKTIEETMNSVLAQSIPPFEYLLIDGASTDSTLSLIRNKSIEFKNRNIPLHVTSKKDLGIYDAMNKSLEVAQGEWIYFLNAGDTFFTDQVLQYISQYLLSQNDLVYGDIMMKVSGSLFKNTSGVPSSNNPMPFSHQGVFLKTEYLKNIKFDLTYRLAADYDLFHKLFELKIKCIRLDYVIALYEAESGESSVNGLQVSIEKFRSNKCLYSFFSCVQSHCIYYLKIFLALFFKKNAISRIRICFYKYLYKA